MVPVNVLEHFLEDVRRHGKYLGFPRMGVIQQRLENPALRQSLKMSEGQTGVLVTSIEVRRLHVRFCFSNFSGAFVRNILEFSIQIMLKPFPRSLSLINGDILLLT